MKMNSSLPYIDTLDEDYEQKAADLIKAEMKGRSAPTMPDLPPSVLEKKHLDEVRLPKFTFSSVQAPSNTSSVEEWKIAIRDARIAYEHERIKSLQLSVDNTSASDVFRTLNEAVWDPRTKALEKVEEDERAVVQQINYERQVHQQQEVGPVLDILQAQFSDLVAKQRQLREAIRELEERAQA